jgi:replicative DNA helicase
MSLFQDFKDRVNEGKEGLNAGFSTGSPNLDSVINGVTNRTYYLIGGQLGTGKTALADHCFVLMPYDEMINQPEDATRKLNLRVFYRSMEIDKISKIAKWTCHYLFRKYGIITDINFVLSKGKKRISQDIYDKVIEAASYMEKMEDHIHIIDSSTNPTGIYMDISKYMDANGKVIETTKVVRGQPITTHKYIPHNPDEIVISITDHIGLLRTEKELKTKKERIDKYSEQAISLRNFYGVSTVAISQFNRELADLDRRKFSELTPQLEDFKDTGGASEDANIVLATFNPLRYNITNYGVSDGNPGLPINRVGGRYRPIINLKNRDGSDMIKLHSNFMGEVGYFRDFPKSMYEHNFREAAEYKKFT